MKAKLKHYALRLTITVSAAFLILVLCTGLAACSGYRRPPSAFHETLTMPYQLDSSDRLRIIVFGQDDLSNTYVVDQAGYISFPLVGSVAARGKTQQGLASEISAKLRVREAMRVCLSVFILSEHGRKPKRLGSLFFLSFIQAHNSLRIFFSSESSYSFKNSFF